MTSEVRGRRRYEEDNYKMETGMGRGQNFSTLLFSPLQWGASSDGCKQNCHKKGVAIQDN